MFPNGRKFGALRWSGRLLHQDVPEGWCEHLIVFRCSSGHLERPDGPEGWCTKMFLKVGANILLCSDVPADTWNDQMARKVGVSILVCRDVPVCWCDQMLRKVSYILVTNDSHYEILILMAVKKTDWKLIVIYYFLLINV